MSITSKVTLNKNSRPHTVRITDSSTGRYLELEIGDEVDRECDECGDPMRVYDIEANGTVIIACSNYDPNNEDDICDCYEFEPELSDLVQGD